MRALTGDFLDWDVPFVASSPPKRELNGPGQMQGTINPEYLRLMAKPDGLPVISEWATALFAEFEGKIRWGGLVTNLSFEGQAMKVDCAGYTAYPNGMPYFGSTIRSGAKIAKKWEYEGRDKNHDGYIDGTHPKRKMPKRPKDTISDRWDAYDVVRHIWAHLQDYKAGKLGVTLDGHDSGYKLGSSNGQDPWTLQWWDSPDCGSTITDVMNLAKADFLERHYWDGSKEKIRHHIDLGKRRLGRARSDLRFAQGENIIEVATPNYQGDYFANNIYVIGKGSGAKTARARVVVDDKRLRRAKIVSNKSTANAKQLTEYGKKERAKHSEQLTIPSIAIRHHSNAPLGSWALGDRILVQVDVPWAGELAIWHRITAEEIDPAAGTAVLTLTRADFYG
ncbi:hypothetical protein HCJ76_44315 [Streptomyces sp. MC1]|uniref:hypothetical protein n=1 Tax=Streptomyces sp. MC1 TaxID=295105 RepID=UPI0018C99655|nr:hypothetical protein [Streptomyces sp. MC1]MBG7704910.1 hypothetical protein [Streptomyces sp. MC1]